MHSAFHGVVPKTRIGLIPKTRILLATSIEDHVDTSNECDWLPDEFGVRSKAATFEHIWVGNSRVSAIECMTFTELAGTPTVSEFHHEFKHQPPLGRVPFSLDDVWCAAFFSVKSCGDVVHQIQGAAPVKRKKES